MSTIHFIHFLPVALCDLTERGPPSFKYSAYKPFTFAVCKELPIRRVFAHREGRGSQNLLDKIKLPACLSTVTQHASLDCAHVSNKLTSDPENHAR